MHEITGQYANAWGQPTTVCACGWVGDTPEQFGFHLIETAKLEEARRVHEQQVADARKALKTK